MSILRKVKDEALLAFMVHAVLVTELLRIILNVLNLPLTTQEFVVPVFRNLSYIICALIVYSRKWHSIIRRDFFLVLSFIVFFSISYYLLGLVDDNDGVFDLFSIFILRCIPVYILVQGIKNYEKLINGSCIYVIVAIIYCGLTAFILGQANTSYMTFSYSLLLPCIICIAKYVNKDKLYIFPLSFFLVSILAYGARGPLLCICLGVLSLLLTNKGLNIKKILLFSFCLFLLITVVMFWNDILRELITLFPSSRTLNMIHTDYTWETFLTGRYDIYVYDLQLVTEYIITGTGIIRDRYFLSNLLGYAKIQQGLTPHNFILEILIQFGVIGFIILIMLFIMLKRSFNIIATLKTVEMTFLKVFIIAYLTQSMVSGSYLGNIQMWMIFGIIVSISPDRYHKNYEEGH